MAENIAIIRGTSNLFEVELTDVDGVPYNLQLSTTMIYAEISMENIQNEHKRYVV